MRREGLLPVELAMFEREEFEYLRPLGAKKAPK